jgi:hypothetical protein
MGVAGVAGLVEVGANSLGALRVDCNRSVGTPLALQFEAGKAALLVEV